MLMPASRVQRKMGALVSDVAEEVTVMTEEASHFQVRFGMIAVEKKFITAHQLVEATTIQVREDVEGKPHRPVGVILADRGHITPSQIDEVLRDIAGGSRQIGKPLRAQKGE